MAEIDPLVRPIIHRVPRYLRSCRQKWPEKIPLSLYTHLELTSSAVPILQSLILHLLTQALHLSLLCKKKHRQLLSSLKQGSRASSKESGVTAPMIEIPLPSPKVNRKWIPQSAVVFMK